MYQLWNLRIIVVRDFFIFDERFPILVSVFVHLQEIRKCIVRQVIVKIAITGHRPRSIRHIERGARLLCLFAELGNFSPLLVLLTF